jgi:deferrochelatase/peroxidase EfeB
LPSRSGSSAAKALRHRARRRPKPSYAHNVLTSIEENGEPLEILRDNMPFGDVGKGEFGTYFIGYARSPHRIERMLENMFIGLPPGNYDRLLDSAAPSPAACSSFLPLRFSIR